MDTDLAAKIKHYEHCRDSPSASGCPSPEIVKAFLSSHTRTENKRQDVRRQAFMESEEE